MGSRLKENPEKTFYWFFQASRPIARDKDPGVLVQFPEDFADEECLQSLPRFCFPYDIERVRDGVAVQHFTFVLTDLEGCQRFGFCRLNSSSQTCLCILSYLPWFEVFYKLLNNMADYLTKGQTKEMQDLLSALYKHPVPAANGSVTLQLIPYFIAPDPKALPSIPESRNLTELVVAVDVGNMLQLYASMLFERRIIICCSKLSTLTACVHACSGMLFPMYWQHIFIPVLPPHLLDYCCAPMPYLIGVHSSLIERVRSRSLEDVVILNVDTNTVESPHDDLKKIPSDVVTALKVRLKRQAASPGAGVARAFLRAQALLFGGYKDALLYPSEGPVFFSDEMFLTHKSHSMRSFLESSIHLQFFKQFIDGRLEMLNQGKEPDDLFEEEILQCGASAGGTKSYQQWVGNLKKGGGALLLTVKSKAQMCKTATYHSKLGLKNLISAKEKDCHSLQRGGSICETHTYRLIQSDCLQNRLPITQHFGKSRPRRPARKPSSPQTQEPLQDHISYGEESHAESGSSAGDLQDDPDLCDLPDPEELDLLGEIFDTLSAQSSREPGLLYSTRSLDVFNSDCTDFITRRNLTTPSQESLNLSFGNSSSLMSWEEGLEEGRGMEEEEGPNVQTDQSETEEFGARPSRQEMFVDLGSLVNDLTDLGEELKEELGDLQPVQDGKWEEQTKQGDCRKKPRQKQNHEPPHGLEEEKNDLKVLANDIPKQEEKEATKVSLKPHQDREVTKASLKPQQEHEVTKTSLKAHQDHKVTNASLKPQQEHEVTKVSLKPQQEQEVTNASLKPQQEQEVTKTSSKPQQEQEVTKTSSKPQQEQEVTKTSSKPQQEQEVTKTSSKPQQEQEVTKTSSKPQQEQEVTKTSSKPQQEQEVTNASLKPQQEQEVTNASLKPQQEQEVTNASLKPQQEHEVTKPLFEPNPEANPYISIDDSQSDQRSEEDQKDEDPHSAPNVLSTVALFQSKVSQTKVSPETSRPGHSPKVLDTSLKSSPRSQRIHVFSGKLLLGPKSDDNNMIPSPNDAPEDLDLPPIKVSELKKRFEQ